MRLEEIRKIVEDAGVPCYKYVIPDPEEVGLPHCSCAKVGTGEGTVYADDGNYYPTARVQLFAAMKNDDRQEDTELMIDKALDDAGISYSYSMGYNADEAIVVKIYTFEIPEEVTG